MNDSHNSTLTNSGGLVLHMGGKKGFSGVTGYCFGLFSVTLHLLNISMIHKENISLTKSCQQWLMHSPFRLCLKSKELWIQWPKREESIKVSYLRSWNQSVEVGWQDISWMILSATLPGFDTCGKKNFLIDLFRSTLLVRVSCKTPSLCSLQ